jgi:hypothetical protein
MGQLFGLKVKILFFKGFGDLVALVDGRPGHIPPFLMEHILKTKTKQIKQKDARYKIISHWEMKEGKDRLSHSGIYLGEDEFFHQNGQGGVFDTWNIQNTYFEVLRFYELP